MSDIKVFRHEMKYFINYHEYIVLRSKLKKVMKVDKYADKNGDYHIRSLYFDDYNDTALFEKQLGILNRKKYRIRIYNLSDKVIKLEKKSRHGQYIHKKSCILDKLTVDDILNYKYEAINSIDSSLAREFYLDLKTKLYRPKVVVDYVREAYTLEYNSIRITFDKFLSTGLNNTGLFNQELPTIGAIDEKMFILEVKYNNFLPSYIKSIIQMQSSQKLAISKYVYCRKFFKLQSWEDQ